MPVSGLPKSKNMMDSGVGFQISVSAVPENNVFGLFNLSGSRIKSSPNGVTSTLAQARNNCVTGNLGSGNNPDPVSLGARVSRAWSSSSCDGTVLKFLSILPWAPGHDLILITFLVKLSGGKEPPDVSTLSKEFI